MLRTLRKLNFAWIVWAGGLAFSMAPVVRGQSAKGCPAEPRQIIQQAAENDDANDVKARSYTYTEHAEEHRLNSDGQVQSTESKTYEILFLAGEQAERLVARNGKPLSPEDNKKEDEKLDKIIRNREKETDEQRQKRLAKEEKERQEDRAFIGEIASAYNFRMEPEETLDGRKAYVISAEPRPDFHATTRDGKYLSKFKFRVWIDEADCQWVKLNVEAIDTVSWGLFLARLHKGSRVELDQIRVNDEIWLPRRQQIWLSARLGLLKTYNIQEDTTFKDYKKFTAESRIVPTAPKLAAPPSSPTAPAKPIAPLPPTPTPPSATPPN